MPNFYVLPKFAGVVATFDHGEEDLIKTLFLFDGQECVFKPTSQMSTNVARIRADVAKLNVAHRKLNAGRVFCAHAFGNFVECRTVL